MTTGVVVEGKRVNRDSLITCYQILKIVLNSSNTGNGYGSKANATKLIYGARLSAESYATHVPRLLKCGLIETVEENNTPYRNYTAFQITGKGIRFMELVRNMKKLLPNDKGLYLLPRNLDTIDDEIYGS